jgi:Fe(3+) dicitrate transport protein
LTAKFGLTFRRDRQISVSITGVHVGSQFWQDSSASTGAGSSYISDRIPAYTTIDLAGDIYIGRNIRLLSGISNMTNKVYYSRVWRNGLEPAARRRFYAGVALGW